MNRCMDRLYLGLFQNFPQMEFFWTYFSLYSGHIEDSKSVEFASVSICSRLTPILTLNDWTKTVMMCINGHGHCKSTFIDYYIL